VHFFIDELQHYLQNLPESFNDCRMKKKGLVKTVQVGLCLIDIKFKLKHFNIPMNNI